MSETEYEDIDSLRFQNLVDEAKRSLQQDQTTWTDHNVSDPGITLLESFAYLVDTLSYRASHIDQKSLEKARTSLGWPHESYSRTVTLADLKDFEGKVQEPVTGGGKPWWATCTDDPRVTKGEKDAVFLIQSEGSVSAATEQYSTAIASYFKKKNRPLAWGLEIASQAASPTTVTVTVTYTAEDTTEKTKKTETYIRDKVRNFMGLPHQPATAGDLITTPWPAGRGLYVGDVYDTLRDGPAKIHDIRLTAANGDDQYVPLRPGCVFNPTVTAAPEGNQR
ncbi:hypothetical protein ACIBEA_43090 [Streptomyces sp. NPDC051555]|uniref:hypothetical protein n=1 Tax=Streptomyces sp. NPDC051555 TaxID=3365657 RepID=UPI0037AEE290